MLQNKIMGSGSSSILRFVFFVFVAFFLLILTTLCALYYSAQKQYMQSFYKEDLENFVYNKSIKASNYFKGDLVLMEAMSKSLAVRTFLKDPNNESFQQDFWKDFYNFKNLLGNKRKIFFVSDADKRFYFDSSYAYKVEEKLPNFYWYDSTLHRTELYNFNIDFDDDLGLAFLWINFPVIYEDVPVGIIGVAIDINLFVADMDEGSVPQKKFVIFNKSSELIFHENGNLVRNKNYVNSVLPEDVIQKLLEAFKQKESRILFKKNHAYVIEELPFMHGYIVANTELDFAVGQGSLYFIVFILVIAAILIFLIALYNFIKRIIKPLQQLNSLTNTILKEVPIHIAVFNKDGQISLMSRYMNIFLNKNGIINDNLFTSVGNSGSSQYFKEFKDRTGFLNITKEFEIESKNHYFNVIKMDIEQDPEIEEQNSILYLSDVSEQMYLANTDSLTSISNKRYFNERANAEFFNNLREKTPIAFLMLDIDFFKQLNDEYGHLVGDNVLKEMAKILSNIIKRRTDLLGRVGGEEFAVMLHNTDLEGAKIVAEKIRHTIFENNFRVINENTITKITVSIGLYSAIPSSTDDFRAFLEEADKKLYEAKKTGRNRVCF